MKTVIVTPQIPLAYRTGDIGTFTWNLTRLLKTHGEDIKIIFTRRPEVPRSVWQAPFAELAVPVVCVDEETMPLHVPLGYSRYQAVAEAVADWVPGDADIVYFADWEANGLHVVRNRRFVANKLPVCVTVLHGGSNWTRQGMRTWPETYHDLSLDFQERYTLEHSDFIAAPSRFIEDWARDNGWTLPLQEQGTALGLPLMYEPNPNKAGALSERFDRIVFFGRLDTAKGIDLFVESLVRLNDKNCLTALKEIVLLGSAGQNIYGSVDDIVQRVHREISQVTVTTYVDLSSREAQLYLAEHAASTLVVIPSRADTLSYAVLETSLIPNLNLICSTADGISEVFGSQTCDQLFEPTVDSLVVKIEQWLRTGPRDSSHLCRYDWEAANQRWLAFHNEVCTYASSIQSSSGADQHLTSIVSTAPQREAPLDVCIPYYNSGTYLPYLLTSLDAQSTQNFNLFVVNNGSTDPESVRIFTVMTEQYQHRENWTFIDAENRVVCQSRNFVASLGHADFICFIDADNIARPDMIERFLESISHSGDDCLTCYMYCFEGKGMDMMQPLDRPVLRIFHIVPIGNCPALWIFHHPYGEGTWIMRRSVFENLGGFTTDVPEYVGHEDRELLTRLSLAGYKLDVIPDFLAQYRLRSDSRQRRTDQYLNDRRVVRHYEARLRQVGLADLASLVVGQYYAGKQGTAEDTSASLFERLNWQREAAEREAERAAMQTRISEVQEAAHWHEQQSRSWEQVAAEQTAQISELQGWASELQEAVRWHEQQSRSWEQVAAEQTAQISELQGWASELQEAVRWHEQQSRSWEQVARERDA